MVMYYDSTFFGGGAEGMLLTDTHLYARNGSGPNMAIVKLSELQEVSISGIVSHVITIKTSTDTVIIKMPGSKAVKIFCEVLKKCIPRAEDNQHESSIAKYYKHHLPNGQVMYVPKSSFTMYIGPKGIRFVPNEK